VESARSNQRDWLGLGAFWLCLRATIVLAALPLLLARLSVARVVRVLTPRRALAVRRPALLHLAVRWVDRVLDLLPFRIWGHCLPRTLTLYYAATCAGYPVRVVLGVRRMPESIGVTGLTGHSWLELDGVPFCEEGEHPAEEFRVIHHLPAV